MPNASRCIARSAAVLIATVIVSGGPTKGVVALAAQVPSFPPNQAVSADLEEGIRLYSGVQYQEALAVFDRVIGTLASGGKAAEAAVLARAYEFRARTRFNRGDQVGKQSDFAALLQLQPDYQPESDMSPKLVPIFKTVRARVVGDALVTLIPKGDIEIDSRVYHITTDAMPVSLVDGEHSLRVSRPGYRSAERKFTITAGSPTEVLVTLERVYGTLTVRTIPDAVEVMVDGVSKGLTPPGGGAIEGSGPMQLADITAGVHRFVFQRKCYTTAEQSIRFDELDDRELKNAVRLEPAVAKVDIQTTDKDVVVYLDGQMVGSATNPLAPLCEGEHAIELRSPRGLFTDRRTWKAGESVTLTPSFRPAFVITSSGRGQVADEWKPVVERSLAAATGALVISPRDIDLQSALRAESVGPDFVVASSAVARMRRHEAGPKIASRLGVQGFASVEAQSAQGPVELSLLAAGSADAEILRFNPLDQTSLSTAIDMLSKPLPPIVRPALDATLIDVADTQGAVVIRLQSNGSMAAAGLAPGDVVTAIEGAPVSSVAALDAALIKQTKETVNLDVRSAATGAAKSVSVTVKYLVDTIPFANGGLLYNRAVFQLQDRIRQASNPLETTSAYLNLAIAYMRVGNWDEANRSLQQVKLGDGAGVSGGTVSYLSGLCLEALGRHDDAVAALTKASQDANATLSFGGPAVAPLAQSTLRPAPAPK